MGRFVSSGRAERWGPAGGIRLVRSAVALALVAGFYLVGIMLAAGYAVFGVVMARVVFDPDGDLGLPLVVMQVLFCLVGAETLLRVLVGPNLSSRPRPGTVRVGRDEAPLLWETVADLADRAGAPAPTEIRLTAEANAAVSESGRVGFAARDRRMYIGLPLLAGLRMDELAAILCHELGHFARGHTRFAGTVYRGAAALDAARRGFGRAEVGSNPITAVYSGFQHYTLSVYAWLYNGISFPVRRRQEQEADASAAAVAGIDATVRALTRGDSLSCAWAEFQGRYLAPMAARNCFPDDPLRAFAATLGAEADGARPRTSVDCSRSRPAASAAPFDPHPTLDERLRTLRQGVASDGAGGAPSPDARAARVLVASLPENVWPALLPPTAPDRPRVSLPWHAWLAEAAATQETGQERPAPSAAVSAAEPAADCGAGAAPDLGSGTSAPERRRQPAYRHWMFVVSAITLIFFYGAYRITNNESDRPPPPNPPTTGSSSGDEAGTAPAAPSLTAADLPVPTDPVGPAATVHRPIQPPISCQSSTGADGWSPVTESRFSDDGVTIPAAAALLETTQPVVQERGLLGWANCTTEFAVTTGDITGLAPLSVPGIPGRHNCVPVLVSHPTGGNLVFMLCVSGLERDVTFVASRP